MNKRRITDYDKVDTIKNILSIIGFVIVLVIVTICIYNNFIKKEDETERVEITTKPAESMTVEDYENSVSYFDLDYSEFLNKQLDLEIDNMKISIGTNEKSESAGLDITPTIETHEKYLVYVDSNIGRADTFSDERYNYYTGFDNYTTYFKYDNSWDLVPLNSNTRLIWNCEKLEETGSDEVKLIFRNLETTHIDYIIKLEISKIDGKYQINTVSDITSQCKDENNIDLVETLRNKYETLNSFIYDNYEVIKTEVNKILDIEMTPPKGYDSITIQGIQNIKLPLTILTINNTNDNSNIIIYCNENTKELYGYSFVSKDGLEYEAYQNAGKLDELYSLDDLYREDDTDNLEESVGNQ